MATRERSDVGSGLLIYDGDCGFCTRTAAWLRRRLPPGYSVEASQRVSDLEAFGLSRREVHEAAYWIDPGGRKLRGHRAIIRAVESSRGALGSLSKAAKVWPIDPLASWVYEVVARNRHRLPGATDHCHL